VRAAHLVEQEQDSDGDEDSGSHESMCATPGARAIRVISVSHCVLLTELSADVA
jgi:hypothetical protein